MPSRAARAAARPTSLRTVGSAGSAGRVAARSGSAYGSAQIRWRVVAAASRSANALWVEATGSVAVVAVPAAGVVGPAAPDGWSVGEALAVGVLGEVVAPPPTDVAVVAGPRTAGSTCQVTGTPGTSVPAISRSTRPPGPSSACHALVRTAASEE